MEDSLNILTLRIRLAGKVVKNSNWGRPNCATTCLKIVT